MEPTTTSTPPATQPHIVQLGPGPTTATVAGSHQDGADLYGIVLAVVVIAVALVAVRLLFRRGSGDVTGER